MLVVVLEVSHRELSMTSRSMPVALERLVVVRAMTLRAIVVTLAAAEDIVVRRTIPHDRIPSAIAARLIMMVVAVAIMMVVLPVMALVMAVMMIMVLLLVVAMPMIVTVTMIFAVPTMVIIVVAFHVDRDVHEGRVGVSAFVAGGVAEGVVDRERS